MKTDVIKRYIESLSIWVRERETERWISILIVSEVSRKERERKVNGILTKQKLIYKQKEKKETKRE